MATVLQQMPHNIDAEKAILGCVMLDEKIQSELLESLSEDDFYEETHRLILAAMKAVYGGRRTVDLVTLTDRMEQDGTLDRAGGIQYLNELSDVTPSAANYKYYLEILHRDAVNRALIRAAFSIMENSAKSPEEGDAIAFAEKLVYDISRRGDTSRLVSMASGEAIQEVLHKFEAIQADPTAYRGVETGFRHLDSITNGLQKSDLIVLAARPGMGKTSLAMNIVEHACVDKGLVVVVFSLEMPYVQIVQRLACAHAGVSMEKALAGKLNQSEWKNLLRASDKIKKSKLYIYDSSRVKPAEILSICRRVASQEGRIDLVMVDYIQLMEGEEKLRTHSPENRQQEIAGITRDLKVMAKELNVPVLALSQLRRIQTKEPQLSDLRESGAIEQDADIVMFINRTDVNASKEEEEAGKVVKGAADLIIAKHRNGKLARIQLRFIGEQTKFIDVESQGEPTEEPTYGSYPSIDDEEDE